MDPEDLVRRFSTQNDSRLDKLCEVLLPLGIDCFWHYSISHSGRLSFLVNRGPISEFFFNQKLYKGHPCFRSPDVLREGLLLGRSHCVFREWQRPMRDEFSLDQVFMICEKKDGAFHGYGFATTQDLPDLSNIYLNNIPYLRRFVRYFCRETADIYKAMEPNQPNIGALIGEAFWSPDTLSLGPNTSLSLSAPLDFSKQLSRRERECLYWLVYGYSARQIGERLNLSKRTVEHYLDNIKDKLGCLTRQELFGIVLRRREDQLKADLQLS